MKESPHIFLNDLNRRRSKRTTKSIFEVAAEELGEDYEEFYSTLTPDIINAVEAVEGQGFELEDED